MIYSLEILELWELLKISSMDKFDEILKRCFKCKSYQENDCGIYFMMAIWNKECKFFKEYDKA